MHCTPWDGRKCFLYTNCISPTDYVSLKLQPKTLKNIDMCKRIVRLTLSPNIYSCRSTKILKILWARLLWLHRFKLDSIDTKLFIFVVIRLTIRLSGFSGIKSCFFLWKWKRVSSKGLRYILSNTYIICNAF